MGLALNYTGTQIFIKLSFSQNFVYFYRILIDWFQNFQPIIKFFIFIYIFRFVLQPFGVPSLTDLLFQAAQAALSLISGRYSYIFWRMSSKPINIRWIRTNSQPFTKMSYISSYLKFVFGPFWANKPGFNLYYFFYLISAKKLSIILCDK